MKKLAIFILMVVIGFCLTGYSLADDKSECIAKCEAAAKMLKEDFTGALCEINKKDGKFVKGNIYVLVMRGGVVVAHPFKPKFIGIDLTNHKDKEGKEFVKEYIKVVKEKGNQRNLKQGKLKRKKKKVRGGLIISFANPEKKKRQTKPPMF